MKSRRSAGRSGTVLVVDPDDAFRRLARKWLEGHDFLVLDAPDVADAERIARVFVAPIHLLLTAVSLRAAPGSALADRLRSLHPELQTVFMNTRSQADLIRKRELTSGQHYLRKPIAEEQLIASLQKILTQSR
jgi:CheY-like chemotaxis protein